METLVEVAFPVFAIVLTGYLAGQFGILGAQSAAALNCFVYYFALPPVLFVFTARAPITEILNWPFIAAFLGGTTLTLIVALAGGRFVFGHDTPRLAMHGLTAVFANTAYMGIPLFLTAFGPDAPLLRHSHEARVHARQDGRAEIFFSHKLYPDTTGQGENGIILINIVSDLFKVLMVALTFQCDLIDLNVLPLVHEIHAEGRGEDGDLFFATCLTDSDALVAA